MEYLIVLNHYGQKETAYQVGIHGDTFEDIMTLATRNFPNSKYVKDDGGLFAKLTPSKAYVNGEIIDFIQTPISVADELRAEKELLLEKYKDHESKIKDRLLTALLHDDDETIEILKDQYQQLQMHFAEKMNKEVM